MEYNLVLLFLYFVSECYTDNHGQRSVYNDARKSSVNIRKKEFALEDFHVEMWNLHNQIRYLHGLELLELDQRLAQNAQDWAECLASDRGEGSSLDQDANKTVAVEFKKTAGDDYGENIFRLLDDEPIEGSPSNLALFHAKTEVDDPLAVGWYTEKETYAPTTASPNFNRFTRLVFTTVKYMGCGVAKGKLESYLKYVVFVVCHYIPPGNVIGEKQTLHQLVNAETVPGRQLSDYKPRNLTEQERIRMSKTKHPLLRYQSQILDILERMKFKKEKPLSLYESFLSLFSP